MQHFWRKDPQNGEIHVQTTKGVKGAFHWMMMTQLLLLHPNENILKIFKKRKKKEGEMWL